MHGRLALPPTDADGRRPRQLGFGPHEPRAGDAVGAASAEADAGQNDGPLGRRDRESFAAFADFKHR